MADVPCNGCTQCCRYGLIFLDPDRDDVASYETMTGIDPRTGRDQPMLKHKPDGSCVYLGDGGCTIHARAPAVCREFDCRSFYLSLTRAERRAANGIHKDVLAEGKARLFPAWGEDNPWRAVPTTAVGGRHGSSR